MRAGIVRILLNVFLLVPFSHQQQPTFISIHFLKCIVYRCQHHFFPVFRCPISWNCAIFVPVECDMKCSICFDKGSLADRLRKVKWNKTDLSWILHLNGSPCDATTTMQCQKFFFLFFFAFSPFRNGDFSCMPNVEWFLVALISSYGVCFFPCYLWHWN